MRSGNETGWSSVKQVSHKWVGLADKGWAFHVPANATDYSRNSRASPVTAVKRLEKREVLNALQETPRSTRECVLPHREKKTAAGNINICSNYLFQVSTTVAPLSSFGNSTFNTIKDIMTTISDYGLSIDTRAVP